MVRVLKRWCWWIRIDERIIIGAFPLRSVVPDLRTEGVRAVVNMCNEYDGPTQSYAELGITQLRLQVVDFVSPTLEHIDKAIDFMNAHANRGESVYVHCKAGRGRSGTVVLCWLIQAKEMSPNQAQELLLEKRPQILKRLCDRQVVQEFYQRHIRNR